MTIPLSDMISQQEAMKVLGVSDEWFVKRRKEGVITIWKPLSGNRNIVYSKKELEKVINLKP